jgi:hypothetical protein
MEARDVKMGICNECQKIGVSSYKPIFHCELCNLWFCDQHRNPKFPYFVDWETQFDVQGDPAVKLMFHTEYRREDGHSDLEYLRNKIMEMELEEQYQDFIIKSAMDRMNLYGKPLRKTVVPAKEKKPQLSENEMRATAIRTYANKFKHDFPIPAGIYSIDEYYDRLNEARTLAEVDEIIDDYRNCRHIIQPKHEQPAVKNKTILKKKKHWWQ